MAKDVYLTNYQRIAFLVLGYMAWVKPRGPYGISSKYQVRSATALEAAALEFAYEITPGWTTVLVVSDAQWDDFVTDYGGGPGEIGAVELLEVAQQGVWAVYESLVSGTLGDLEAEGVSQEFGGSTPNATPREGLFGGTAAVGQLQGLGNAGFG